MDFPYPPVPNFSYSYDEKESKAMVSLTEDEEKARREDYEEIKEAKHYRDRNKQDWIAGGMSYNVVQEGTTDDRVSNIYIGLGRMVIDQGIAMMTEGEPEFDFDPIGPADSKKTILWRAAVKMILSQCNYKSHQDKFITDFHVFGPGVFEAYTQLPMRTVRDEDENGNITSRLTRDFMRTKVGVRHVSPFQCWRNPNVTDPDEVPSCGKEEILTRNQFIQNYGNIYYADANGIMKPKYKNIEQVLAQKGSHVKVTRQENEITDSIRIYAFVFGNNPEGKVDTTPELELGLPIFDKPLKIKKYKGSDGKARSCGLNALGMTTLCFGANNDMYDSGYETHSLYGMGIPRLIEGPDMAMQAFTNMNFDNMRLANTFALSYKPYDGKTYLDMDNTRFYSGMQVDGDLVSTPFGQVRLSENSYMNDWLNNTTIAICGINFLQLVGDDLKTAFQAGLRVRQSNQRALKRIRSLENGCLKRMGTLLLANILSEMTVEEWEELTEEQAHDIAGKISKGEVTAEDYKDLNGKKPKRKVQFYMPVEGIKEDFSYNKDKRRKLSANASDNTLIEDYGKTNYIALDKKYMYPIDDIESIMRFTTKVDGKHMLGDMKVQDMDMWDKLISIYLQMQPLLPNVDPEKLFSGVVRFVGEDDSKIMKHEGTQSDILKKVSDIVKQMEATSQQSDAMATTQAPAMAVSPGASRTPSPGAGANPGQPSPVLESLAQGTV